MYKKELLQFVVREANNTVKNGNYYTYKDFKEHSYMELWRVLDYIAKGGYTCR